MSETWPDRRSNLFQEQLGQSGPLLVFLSGVGGTTRYWKRRVAPLADDHRVLLVDLLGFGRSTKPWKQYTMERHLAALRRTLEGRGPMLLVGHSFGAITALAYAARHPGEVSGLILMSFPYFGSLDGAIEYYRHRGFPDRWLMTNIVLAAITCVVTRRILARALPRLLNDLPREVAEDLVLHTWLSSTSTIWDGIYRYDPSPDAARLPAELPVLLLHGDRDTTAPLGGASRLAAKRPGWQLRVLAGADHHPFLRDPATCRAVIASFARDAVAGADPPS